MEKSNLQPEEEAIRKMLANTFHEEGFGLDIENDILKEVCISKDKLFEIAALKRKARICLGMAAAFLVIYALTCTNIFLTPSTEMVQTEGSILAFNLSIVVGILLVFMQAIVLRNSSKNILSS